MHDLIATPIGDAHLILRPGSRKGIKISRSRFEELDRSVSAGEAVPPWLENATRHAWGMKLAGRPAAGAVLVRAPGPYEFSRATWEINLGCDFDCEHCYLGQKRFEGLDWFGKQRLLHVLRDAGVVWLQITGGEPLIDPHFPDAYRLAYELGMQVEILSNGSRLWQPRMMQLLTTCPPAKLSLSVYGASPETYDGLTRRRGAFQRFTRGLDAAVGAGLNVDLSLIVTGRNAHCERGRTG
ncbi:radical SAM protein [Streptomyces lydicus]|uniref:radical SAM protein n=1 Tax=Streptomyces lydicus TaxID=47763 RepID=UPI0036FDE5BE